MDSNHRYRMRNNPFWLPSFGPRNSPSATKTGCFVPGTDGSNPSPSSGESTTNSRMRTQASPSSWIGGDCVASAGLQCKTAIAPTPKRRCGGPVAKVRLAARSKAKDDRETMRGRITMTSRVSMVSLERARELGEAMGLPAGRTQSEAFRVLANNPGVARVVYSQLIQLLENNKFDTRLRELMIMRIGWVTGSAYEWTQHWRVAATAGISARGYSGGGRLAGLPGGDTGRQGGPPPH